METMDHQDRRNRQIKFLDDGGNCDDPEDHMETGFTTHFSFPKNMQANGDVALRIEIQKTQ